MEALKDNLEEIEIGSSVESFRKFLDSQKELFHSQIDQLQRIVVNQCQLTGVNPLSQEMAAGAMSIKIGKRPRDLLNPKAIKYMQAVFSLKDAISKKESREISAQFGVTVTQVRDFFASQRSRVRKLVRLSREKATRTNAHKEPQDGVPASSDPLMPINVAPLNSVHPDPVPLNFAGPNGGPVNSVGPSSVEEAPSCSTQDDVLPGLNDTDKNFVENIFIWLRKEEAFSGQVKLMEWILQIQNPSVLNWFLTKGGVMILATWLSQAAAEEQTSVLLVALKVLCHLPLHKALPEHMSAILHSVNRLRFYRTSDISNRARVLLSRWSKIFARSQAMKKPNGVKSSIDAQEMILKQSIDEIMGNELWQANVGNPEDGLTLSETSENTRKVEPSQTLKLLPSSSDDSSRKHVLGVSLNRERRKVQLVEQPGQKTASRSPQASKAVSVSQSRPMSTDDIQKAKMRALFMQGKYGKTSSSSSGTIIMKTESANKSLNPQASNFFPPSKVPFQPKVEQGKPLIVPPKVSDKHEGSLDPKHKMDSKEPLGEMCKRAQIPWKTPSEMKLNSLWRVSTGENSKEVDAQKNRNRREIETIYRTASDIPSDPKEPWDLEMDYDDTLTPDIPVEQTPDADVDASETQLSHDEHLVNNTVVAPAASFPQNDGGSAPEPDLELLAVLLKNPELVFALTSAQGGNLSSEETVKLLDMIKRSGAGLASGLNGVGGEVEEKVEVSLPSPTPSSNPGTSGWRPEDVKNPFSLQGSRRNRVAYTDSGLPTHISSIDKHTGVVQPQNQASNFRMSQQQASLQILSQQEVQGAMPPFSWPQTTSSIPENRQPSMVLPSHQSFSTKSTVLQTQALEMGLATKNSPATSHSLHNFSATIGPSMLIETLNNIKQDTSVSFAMNAPDRRADSFPMQIATPTPTRSHSLVSEPALVQSSTGNLVSMPDSWRVRQGFASNSASQVSQNNNDGSFRGSAQPQLRSGPRWERNEYKGDEGFESWSPENSPARSPEYMQGRNYPESSRINPGWNNRSRQQNYSGRWDHNRNGSRRWR